MADSLNPLLVYASSDLIPYILDNPGPVDYSGRRYTIAETQAPRTGSGSIQAATGGALGINYAIGDQFTINGGVHLAAAQVLAIYNNTINGEAINNGGSGWAVNDAFTVNGGSVLATGHVTHETLGVADGIFIDFTGDGYSVAAGVATTRTSGSGTGLTINITSTANGLVKTLNIINGGVGYSVASGVATTATSGIGTGLTINITQTGFSLSKVSIFMSVDDGLTWARQDQGNELSYTGDGWACGMFYPKAGGNTIYLAFAPDPSASGTGTLNLQTFNMDTNTWGTPITGGPSMLEGDWVRLFRRSNGSSIVLYGNQQTGTGQTMHWITYAGGWGSPQNVPLVAGTFNFYLSGLMDTNDWVRFLIGEGGGGHGPDLLYGVISPTNVATTGIDTGVGDSGNDFEIGNWGDYIIGTSTAVFPLSTYDSNGSGSTPQGGVIKCTGSPSAPSFTYETVNITEFLDPTNSGLSTRFALSPDGTTERFFWLTYHVTTSPAANNVFYATQAAGTTSWSASTVLWNYVANPPNPTPPVSGVEQLFNLSWSSDNQIGIILAGWVSAAGTSFCDIIYYLSVPSGSGPPPPPQPTLACPITNTGQIGKPFTAQLQASGGTPPYTFSVVP